MISTFSDRGFSVWAKWGGGPVTGPPGPTTFRFGRTFGRVTTPGSDPLLTSHNSRIHVTKRQGDFFSRSSAVGEDGDIPGQRTPNSPSETMRRTESL